MPLGADVRTVDDLQTVISSVSETLSLRNLICFGTSFTRRVRKQLSTSSNVFCFPLFSFVSLKDVSVLQLNKKILILTILFLNV